MPLRKKSSRRPSRRAEPGRKQSKQAKPPKAAKASKPAAPPKLPAMVRVIENILDSFKAERIRAVALENHVADAFVVASATSIRHLHSLAENLMQKMEEGGYRVHHVEGYGRGAPSDRWVLVDFIDVVVHLFTPEGREYFDFDRLIDDVGRKP